ncbi:predicted protein [Naegleria gruberi]|uniref:Predicted protein n=1 Tax=Naegleria gruberi TaxID=5762 RepID=D2V619_NAEGR|nr:uncharacterized protein NAEGRDRAFT_64280 [Naegleria gruberi]EFC47750.1 predicted protein [Naegleria gruberi]|eukprot:XP_002680494.1 predicted protein [Naegleria gruberi strain NEG-M]
MMGRLSYSKGVLLMALLVILAVIACSDNVHAAPATPADPTRKQTKPVAASPATPAAKQTNSSITEIFTCFGIKSDDKKVCNGLGTCIGKDKCRCMPGKAGPECKHSGGLPPKPQPKIINSLSKNNSTKPVIKPASITDPSTKKKEIFTCFGIKSDEKKVCNGKGTCIGTDKCRCMPGKAGPECKHSGGLPPPKPKPQPKIKPASVTDPSTKSKEIFTCFGIKSDEKKVCNGLGTCIGKDKCRCMPGKAGPECKHSGGLPPNPKPQPKPQPKIINSPSKNNSTKPVIKPASITDPSTIGLPIPPKPQPKPSQQKRKESLINNTIKPKEVEPKKDIKIDENPEKKEDEKNNEKTKEKSSQNKKLKRCGKKKCQKRKNKKETNQTTTEKQKLDTIINMIRKLIASKRKPSPQPNQTPVQSANGQKSSVNISNIINVENEH